MHVMGGNCTFPEFISKRHNACNKCNLTRHPQMSKTLREYLEHSLTCKATDKAYVFNKLGVRLCCGNS